MTHTTYAQLLALTLAAGTASAQYISEDQTYTPGPTLQGAYGTAVDVDNGIMVVGAVSDNTNGVSAGAAYLVDLSDGSQIKLLPAGVDEGDFFGFSVAISGPYAVVGAPFDRDIGFKSGAVYIFDSVSGALLNTIKGSANSEFGESVDVDGSLLIVGARDLSPGGEAYLYDVTTSALLHSFVAQSAFGFDEFGDAVAVDASRGIACVSAPGEYVQPINERVGVVHVFSTSTGTLVQSIVSPEPEPTDFGDALDAAGGMILVGAPKYPDFVSDEGAAYLYDANSWALLHTLRVVDSLGPTQFNSLGAGVAIGDGVAIVGAPFWDFPGNGEGFDNGAGFLFDLSTGALAGTYIPSTATMGDQVGAGVGIDGSTIALGVPGDDYAGGFFPGSVAVFSIPCTADLDGSDALDFGDVSAFLSAFALGDLSVDFDDSGSLDFGDVSAFLALFAQGCE